MEFNMQEAVKTIQLSVNETDMMMNAINQIKNKLDYQYVRRLGRGSFGHIFIMVKSETKEKFAMKVVLKVSTASSLEVKVWPNLNHKNILRLQETIFIPSQQAYVFVMPLQMIALDRMLRAENFRKDPHGLEKIKKWFFGVLSGLEYLHWRRLCHCDLKADNVLISHDLDALICDFSFLSTTTRPVTRYGLPYIYRPPEVCYSRGFNTAAEGKPFDLWTMGTLALFVLTGRALRKKMTGVQPVWSKNVYLAIYDIIKIKKLTKHVSRVLPSVKITDETVEQMRNFITSFLRLDLSHRMPASVAKMHEFLGGNQIDTKPDSIWIRRVKREDIDRIVTWYTKPDYTVERYDSQISEEEIFPRIEICDQNFTCLTDSIEPDHAVNSGCSENRSGVDALSVNEDCKNERKEIAVAEGFSSSVHEPGCESTNGRRSKVSQPRPGCTCDPSDLKQLIAKSRELLSTVNKEIQEWREEAGLIYPTRIEKVVGRTVKEDEGGKIALTTRQSPGCVNFSGEPFAKDTKLD